MAHVRRHAPPVVTMDLGLPPDSDSVSEGFKLLEQILTAAPDTKVIVVTGQNDRSNAVRAVVPLGRSFEVRLWPILVFLRDGRIVRQLARPGQAQLEEAFRALVGQAKS